MNKPLCFLALALVATARIHAATDADYTVAFPKGDQQWTVLFAQKTLSPTASPTQKTAQQKQIQKIDITRTGNLRRDAAQWMDGHSEVYWWIQSPPLVLFESPAPGQPKSMRAGTYAERRFDETTFAWVARSNFVDVQTVGGKNCKHYLIKIPYVEDELKTLQAWIDDKTGVPVAYDDDGARYYLTFNPIPPTVPLVLPPNMQQESSRAQAVLAPPSRNVPAEPLLR